MSTRANSVLRWVAVLPAAIGAYAGVAFFTVLQERVLDFPFVICQLTSALFAPMAFVYAGTKTAPSNRLTTAISLTVLHGMLIAGSSGIILYQISRGSQYPASDPWWWELVRAVVSIVASIGVCVGIARSEGRLHSDSTIEPEHEPFDRN